MRRFIPLSMIAAAAGVTIASVAPAATPVRVTRFHFNAPIERGDVIVEGAAGGDPQSLETQLYADAVRAELARQGFRVQSPGTPNATVQTSTMTATVIVHREVRDLGRAPPPVSIGIGGGSFGGGIGGGGSIGFGIGKGRQREAYATRVEVQLRRPDRTVIWEGRAENEVDARSREAQPAALADKMARALFRGFPGESGRTISVR